MYKNAWCTSKVVVLLMKPFFFDILVAVASSDLKLSLNNCAVVSHLKNRSYKSWSPLNHFIITVQEAIIVEAHIVPYTATAEYIEDWTERNLHRDRFTDNSQFANDLSLIRATTTTIPHSQVNIIAILWQKINFHKVNDIIIIHLMRKIYIFFKINRVHWMKF